MPWRGGSRKGKEGGRARRRERWRLGETQWGGVTKGQDRELAAADCPSPALGKTEKIRLRADEIETSLA